MRSVADRLRDFKDADIVLSVLLWGHQRDVMVRAVNEEGTEVELVDTSDGRTVVTAVNNLALLGPPSA